jgi:hypothetical protein
MNINIIINTMWYKYIKNLIYLDKGPASNGGVARLREIRMGGKNNGQSG